MPKLSLLENSSEPKKKVKVKLHSMKTCRESKGTNPLILKLGTRWR